LLQARSNENSADFIYGLYRTRQGDFLVGNESGVDRFDSKTKSFSHFPLIERGKDINAAATVALMQDSKDIVWLGGVAGVASYNPFTKESRQYHLHNDSSDIRNELTIGIAEDKNGKYWAVNFGGGFYSFDPVSGYAREIDVREETDAKGITGLGELVSDSKGLLHIYGVDGGFITFDPATEKFKVYSHDPADSTSVSHQHCHSFIETQTGLIWFATEGGGINVFNPATGKFKAFTTKDGLSDNLVICMVKDKHGNFWAGTGPTCKISFFSPPADPFVPGCRVKFRNYDRSDGLPFSTFALFSSYCDGDGTLYFGTQGGGLVSFHPDSLKDNDFIPPIRITEFSLNNKPVSISDSNSVLKLPIEYTRTITLNYRQNIVSFAFAALNYIHPEKNSYAYKLENYDKDWIYTDASKRFANYTNLDPGEYTFKVKGSNNDGVWNETPTEIRIIITPPFWQTIWFKILLVLAAIAIAYTFYRYRVAQILLLQRIRNKIAADLHDDIGSTLNSIALYSDLAKKQPAQRDRALDMIGESARKIIDSMSDIVWMINPKNDSFDKIIFRMRSLTHDLLRTKKIDCQFKYDETLNEMSLPMGIRRNIYLIFKEALNNMIKYSNATRASVKMLYESKNIVLLISDNGIGFDHSLSHNGNGISNMVQRAEEIGGKIKIESEHGAGTNIELHVKL
jgi:two-component sensor histidine kinase/streptogramin lyase